MKLYFKLLIFFVFAITTHLVASQEETDNIAKLSASSLYNIDKNSLQKTTNAYIQNKPNVIALKIVEVLSGETYYQMYRDDENIVYNKSFPKNLETYEKYTTTSKYEGEDVGIITAYYSTNKITLTNEEKSWLKSNEIYLSVDNQYAPMNFENSIGQMDGLSIDYIKLIEKKIGYKINLDTHKWPIALDNAMKHKTDGIINANETKERSKKLIFTQSYISVPMVLITATSAKTHTTLNELKPKTVLVKEKTVEAEVLPKKYPSLNIKEVSSYKEALTLISSNKAYGVFGHLAVLEYEINKYALPNLKKNFLSYDDVVTKQAIGIRNTAPQLRSILNKAINSITLVEKMKINSKWMGTLIEENNNTSINLNEEEKSWILENPSVKVIEFFDEPPFTLNNSSKNGYMYELVEYLVKSAGLELSYIKGFDNYAQMLQALETQKADILTTYPMSLDLGKSSNIVASKSVLKTSFVIIGKVNNGNINSIEDLFGKRVAVVKGYAQDSYLDKFPRIKKVHISNNQEGFDAVRSGKADYYVNNRANTEYIINKNFLTDLKIHFELNYNDFPPLSISFAMNDKNPILVSILQKALEQMPLSKIKEIRNKWIISTSINEQKIVFNESEKKWLEKNPTIRLAYMNYWPVDDNADNIHTEYIGLLSKYGNLNISLVKYDTWKKGFEEAKKGNNSFGILNLSWSNDRQKNDFDYTKPYFFTPGYIVVRKDNNTIKSIEDLANKTVLLKENAITNRIVKELKSNIKVVNGKNEESLSSALSSKKSNASALLTYIYDPELLERYDLKVANKFFSKSGEVHLGISKKHKELYSILNKVYETIPKNELSRIQNKIYKKAQKIKVDLTSKEKEFLKQNSVIRVHNEENWPPFNFYEFGQAKGYSVDLMKLVAKNTGLKIEFISGPTWNEFLSMMKSDKLDLMINIVENEKRKEYLDFTDPFIQATMGIAVNEKNKDIRTFNDLLTNKIALEKGFFYHDYFLENHPKTPLLEVDNGVQTLQAVSLNKADATIGFVPVMKYIADKNFINGLNYFTDTDSSIMKPVPLRFATQKNQPELLSILQKGLASIKPEQMKELSDRWLGTSETKVKNSVSLTNEEKEWISNNVVKVGVEEWAPIIFSHSGNDFDGITGDVLQLIVEKTGLKLDVVNTAWDVLLNKFKNKELDLLPATYYTDERATYGLYSQAYYKMLDYIYVKENNHSITSLNDLKGKTLAIPKDFGTIPKIRKNFPDITIVETRDQNDSIQRVLRGEVDALYDGQIAIEYLLQENLIVGLKGIAQKSFEAAPLHMFSHIDKPILRDILNKALNNIPPYEINKIKAKWLIEKRNERIINNIDKTQNTEETISIIIISIGIFLFLLLILIVSTRFISNDFVAKSFGSSKFRILALIILSIVIFVLATLVQLTLSENKKNILNSTKSDLEFVLKTTQDRLDTWIEERKNYLKQMGRDAQLVLLVDDLLKVKKDKDSLAFSVELQAVRTYFEEREKEFGKLGFFIIDKNYISVGSRRDTNIGTKNLIANNNPKLLKRVFEGEAVFIPPMISDVNIKNEKIAKEHTMFFAVPIQDRNGNVIAAMTQRLDVEGKFSEIVQSGRIGQSGESYLFSKDGFMLTKSRFRNDLIEIGLLKEGEKEYESLILKDPGGNLLEGYSSNKNEELPLTTMAKNAISLDESTIGNYSKVNSNVEGYRDYRGVDVFGAWIWYKKYGIGLTTELDESEALSEFYTLRQNLIIITGLTLLLTIMAVIMLIILGEKATKSIKKANEELNKLLESFDDNVIASKTDARGIIKYASKAFCEISGYTQEELIGSPQSIVRHPDMPKELFKDLWSTIQSGKSWRGEVKNKKKNGDFYWVDVVIEPEFDDNENIVGYSAIRQDITSKKEVEELSENLELKVEERTSELKESEKRFVTLFDAAPDSISIIKDGKYIDCNQKTLELFGVTSQDAFRKNKPSDFSPKFQENGELSEELAVKKIEKAIQHGYNRFEWIHKRLDTQENFYAEVILSLITLNNEPHIYAVVRDISERKKAQQKIADQKQYIDSIMNSQSNIVISTDGEKLRTANKAFFDFFDVKDVQEFLDTLGDCICDTFDTTVSEEFIQKMMGEEKWIEYVYNRPEKMHKAIIQRDGEKHIFSITSDRFEFAGEMLEVAVFTDITEIEAIRNNIETILSNIMLPVLITSKKERTILYANDYASKQYETDIDKLVGSSIDNVYTKLDQKDEILEVMSNQGYVENLEEKYKTKTGKEFIGLLSVKPIIYNNEESYIGMVVDITKQKEIEDEIRRIHKHTQSSIEYASLIQHSLIPSNDSFKKYFEDYFTIWHPKDIVGGDIYLFEELRNEDECLLIVIDCTGHGVPGAFVTMLVKAIERQVAAIIASDPSMEVSPAWILKYFNQTMKTLLKQEDDDAISNAGFDGAVLYYNKKEELIRFAGAEIPLFYTQDGEFKTIKGNRHSIGYKKSDATYEFKEHIIEAKKGMQFYLTSDGYIDQNGGEKSFPFGKKRFLSILEKYKDYSFADQQEVLLNELQEYQKDEERNDDITIVGIKIADNSIETNEENESWVI